MAESVMRQGMTTWVKKECQYVGNSMFNALSATEHALAQVYELDRLDIRHVTESYIVGQTRMAISHISNLLTADEKREIFELLEEIEEGLKVKISTKDTRLRLIYLADIIKKYLLEKVVECQCGKPGSSSSSQGGNKMAELKSGIANAMDDEMGAYGEYMDLATKASELGRTDIAEGLKRIAEDEYRHRETLDKMIREL